MPENITITMTLPDKAIDLIKDEDFLKDPKNLSWDISKVSQAELMLYTITASMREANFHSTGSPEYKKLETFGRELRKLASELREKQKVQVAEDRKRRIGDTFDITIAVKDDPLDFIDIGVPEKNEEWRDDEDKVFYFMMGLSVLLTAMLRARPGSYHSPEYTKLKNIRSALSDWRDALKRKRIVQDAKRPLYLVECCDSSENWTTLKTIHFHEENAQRTIDFLLQNKDILFSDCGLKRFRITKREVSNPHVEVVINNG